MPTVFKMCRRTMEDCEHEYSEIERNALASAATLLTMLRKAAQNIKSTMKAIEGEAERKKRSEAKAAMAKAKAKAKGTGTAGSRPGPASSQAVAFAVCQMKWAQASQMTTYKGTLLEDQREAHDWATPFMVSASDTAASLLNEPPCQLNFVVFSAACKKDMAVNPAMKRVNELTQSSSLRDRLLQEFAPPKNHKDQKMNKVPADIERVILFGHGMEFQSISVEAFCVSSLRIYTSGEALVATCPYSGVADYAATNLPDKPQNIPFGRLRNEVFCNIEPDQRDELAKQTKLRTTHVVAPAVVYVPHGHVMLEKSINNTQSFGVQVGFVHDSGITDCQVQSFKHVGAL